MMIRKFKNTRKTTPYNCSLFRKNQKISENNTISEILKFIVSKGKIQFMHYIPCTKVYMSKFDFLLRMRKS